MTGLLVSVRDEFEAEDATAGGASVVDVKEPSRGPLGRADAQTLRNVCSTIGQRLPLSAALGEVTNPPDESTLESLRGYQFAKLGLAGAASTPHWQFAWRELVTQIPTGTKAVAVIYADWRACGAPSPDAILNVAPTCNCAAVLIDTYNKRAGNLHAWMSLSEILHVAHRAQHHGMRLVLAGSLGLRDFAATVRQFQPWLLAVRGAACSADRTGRISARRVAVLARRLHEISEGQRSSSCPTALLKSAVRINQESAS